MVRFYARRRPSVPRAVLDRQIATVGLLVTPLAAAGGSSSTGHLVRPRRGARRSAEFSPAQPSIYYTAVSSSNARQPPSVLTVPVGTTFGLLVPNVSQKVEP